MDQSTFLEMKSKVSAFLSCCVSAEAARTYEAEIGKICCSSGSGSTALGVEGRLELLSRAMAEMGASMTEELAGCRESIAGLGVAIKTMQDPLPGLQ